VSPARRRRAVEHLQRGVRRVAAVGVPAGRANWREIEQARNLAAVLAGLAASDRLLVWCGNGHASRFADDDWTSMGHPFAVLVAEGALSSTRR
jgi:hypothetical protein